MTNTRSKKPAYRSNSQIKIMKTLDRPKDPADFHSDIRIIQKKPPYKKVAVENQQLLPAKYQRQWYMKEEGNRVDANNEVLAQELLRLLMPYYPKTRVVKPTRGNKIFVMSKGIPGYQGFHRLPPDEVVEKILNGTYRGFGAALVGALFVNEIDFRPPNLAVDKEGHIIKIDGGLCFINLVKSDYGIDIIEANYTVSSRDIDVLPYLETYQPARWFHQKEKEYQFDEISKSAIVRKEINETIFKIILLPDELLNEFVSHYLQANEFQHEVAIYVSELIQRRDMIRTAAKNSQAFLQYIHTKDAKETLTIFIKSLNEFTLTQKEKLSMTKHEEMMQYSFFNIISSVKYTNNKNLGVFANNSHNSEVSDALQKEKTNQSRCTIV